MSTSISDSGIVVAAGRTERAVAIDVAREFLDAIARRDLAAADVHLAPGFEMTISGGHRFRSLADFVAFSARRNGTVRKAVETLEACESATGIAVYAMGTMSGTWLDGSAFSRVRYVDRFHIVDGRIADLQVWSDMGEQRPR